MGLVWVCDEPTVRSLSGWREGTTESKEKWLEEKGQWGKPGRVGDCTGNSEMLSKSSLQLSGCE